MTDVRTLAEIATLTPMLQVACSRCERHGRYRLDTLIARHGAEASVRVIEPKLIADCPQRDAAGLMERCDILFSACSWVPAGSNAGFLPTTRICHERRDDPSPMRNAGWGCAESAGLRRQHRTEEILQHPAMAPIFQLIVGVDPAGHRDHFRAGIGSS